jgi:hypothetical protein
LIPGQSFWANWTNTLTLTFFWESFLPQSLPF